MQQKVYGYMRVSTCDQNEDRQRRALLDHEVPPQNLFLDKMSGKDFQRPEYRRLIRQLKPGDVLFIKSIDRLGRNYKEIIHEWSYITKEKQVDIVVLDMPLLDTRFGKDLLGTFLSDIVLQLLSFVAENERTNIRSRQAEGIAAAKERGVQFGRPPKPVPECFPKYCELWGDKSLSGSRAAKECNMPVSTFRWKARRYLNKQNVGGLYPRRRVPRP